MLNKINIIWSKGFLFNKYSRKNTEKISNEDEIINLIINSEKFIFIRMGGNKSIIDLDIFSNQLDKIKKPLILITTDGDRLVPSSYNQNTVNKILDCNNITKWLTQNYDGTINHKKLSYYPIGFDLHSNKFLINKNIKDKINFMIKCRNDSSSNERIQNKIFSDGHIKFTHSDREKIYNLIKNNNMFDLCPEKKKFSDITLTYNKYIFVLSPRGRGLDCHRTWELFLAGCIVITKTSALDNMYVKNNLPVIILKDWDDLININENTLKKWYNLEIKKTNIDNIFPKLMYQYWI